MSRAGKISSRWLWEPTSDPMFRERRAVALRVTPRSPRTLPRRVRPRRTGPAPRRWAPMGRDARSRGRAAHNARALSQDPRGPARANGRRQPSQVHGGPPRAGVWRLPAARSSAIGHAGSEPTSGEGETAWNATDGGRSAGPQVAARVTRPREPIHERDRSDPRRSCSAQASDPETLGRLPSRPGRESAGRVHVPGFCGSKD